MAGYKNSIMLGITLPEKNDVQGRLLTLINELNKNKITLDLTLKDNNIVQTLEKLNSILDVTKQKMGGDITLGNIGNTINQTIQSVEKLNGELLKTSTTNYGDIITNTQKVATGIGEVTNQTLKFQNLNGELKQMGSTMTTVTENTQKFNVAMNNIENAQKSLSTMKLNNIVDVNSIEKLKNDLNTIYTESKKKDGIKFSESELNNYLNQIKQLEVEESNLKKIEQERLQQLQKEMELSNKLVENNQKRQSKEDSSNLKLLQQEQELLQKQEQAYQQINVLKANGVINTSEISKLEQLVRSASSIKEINSALSSIGTSTNRESSISALTKQIQEAQAKLEQMKTSFGSKLPSGFIQSTEAELNKLLADLKQVDGTNFTGIKNSLNSVNSSMKETSNETRQLVSSLNQTGGSSFFSSMSNFLGKIGVFYGVQQVVQEISDQFRKAGEYTLAIDKNITNIQMITSKSKEEVIGLTNQFKQLGEQLHITNREMLAGSEELLRAGYDNDTTSKMLEASSMASKISGQTTQATTEQLIAIKNSFNMTGDQMQHVIDVISKLDNTSATSFKEISSAIMRTAFSAQQAGTSFDTLSSYITTVSEKTRRSAETIGESFKSVYSRYYNIKLGNIDEDGKNINDVEKAMNNVGVAIRTSKGEFKDFDIVLEEFVNKYKSGTMSQVDFLAGVNTLGGTRKQNASYVQKCA